MTLLAKRTAVLAKIETTYGTDAVPVGTTNALLIADVSITPMESKTDERVLIRPYLGQGDTLVSQINSKVDITVELAGSGAAGTAPPWGTLLRGCGYAETLTASVKAEYSPISTGQESLTLYVHLDGVLHKLTGARGSFSLDFSEDKRPTIKFSFTGLFAVATDVALPTVTLTAWQAPLPVNKVNTPTFTLHGYAAALSSMSIDAANSVIFRSLVNGTDQVLITDRKPAGSALMEAVTVATKDWWTSVKNGTTGALALVHGTTAGNKVQIDAPKVQLLDPQYQDQDSIRMLQAKLVLIPSAGNDELKITAL